MNKNFSPSGVSTGLVLGDARLNARLTRLWISVKSIMTGSILSLSSDLSLSLSFSTSSIGVNKESRRSSSNSNGSCASSIL